MLALGIIILIIGIAYIQAQYGLFSSLVMALCTLVCTLVAFNFYEPLVFSMGLYDRLPAYAEAIALIALLVLPLLAIRFAVDRYLPGNVVPAVLVDRIGGAAFGVFTGLLLVGTLVIALQMLPFGRSVLGYDPFDEELKPSGSLVVDAPGFTLGLVKTLSGGSMAGGRDFSKMHDDFTLELWAARNRLDGARTDCISNAMKVQSVHDVTDLTYPGKNPDAKGQTFGVYAPSYPGVGSGASKVYALRVGVTRDAQDTDGWWRLMGTQFRLVTENGRGVYPVAYMTNTGDWQVFSGAVGALQINRPSESKRQAMLTLDLLFRVPFNDEGKPADLAYLAFRRGARSEIPKIVASMPSESGSLTRKEVHGKVAIKPNGSTTAFFRPRTAQVETSMPDGFRAKVAARKPGTVNLSGNGTVVRGSLMGATLVTGELKGDRDLLYTLAGSDPKQFAPVVNFHQPQGMKVVTLTGVGDQSGFKSFVGLQKAAGVAFQPYAILTNGEEVPAVGAWVRWNANGKDMVHLVYTTEKPDQYEEAAGRRSGPIMDVAETYRKHGKEVTQFGLVFLLSDNVKVSGFRLGGKDKFSCESPLSTARAARRSRGRRR